jgi:hypothetical protein
MPLLLGLHPKQVLTGFLPGGRLAPKPASLVESYSDSPALLLGRLGQF